MTVASSHNLLGVLHVTLLPVSRCQLAKLFTDGSCMLALFVLTVLLDC